uniref:Deoxyribonuclease-1-like 1 n=1 Tax=Scophthalmus maximus TaxID=52904 RepID=A0A8D3D2E9_SCOMX
MRSSSLLLLSFLASVAAVRGASDFRVCAFNLHHFGDSKTKKSAVMHTLTRIIARCDVCLLQEVRDSKATALPQLLTGLNSYDTEHKYDAVASVRLGRSESYQEQYVFVYRTDTVTVTGQYQYPDDRPGDVDAFSREPFVVRFKAPKTVIKEFVLIPQHTTPVNTTRELDALYDVLQHMKKLWKTQNVMLLGDFNADCGYLAKKNRKYVRLITDTELVWLIEDKTDTTVRSTTSCTYDRIVVHGETFVREIVPLSAKPFNFQTEYRLTEEQALEVSDHYPVEVLLKIFLINVFSGNTLTCHPGTEYQIRDKCCPLCPPGKSVIKDCTELRSTSCLPCVNGTSFTTHPNGLRECFPCASCSSGSGLKISLCTTTSDTVCEPLEGFYCTDQTGSRCVGAQRHKRCKPGQYIRHKVLGYDSSPCDVLQVVKGHAHDGLHGAVSCLTLSSGSEAWEALSPASS